MSANNRMMKLRDAKEGVTFYVAINSIVAVAENRDDNNQTLVTFNIGGGVDQVLVATPLDEFIKNWGDKDFDFDYVDLTRDEEGKDEDEIGSFEDDTELPSKNNWRIG